MSEAEIFTGRRYEIVAFAKGQKPIYYEEIEASYGEDGAWLLIATDASGVSAYTGDSKFCYSCHPDHFTEEFGIGPFLFSVGLEYQSDLGQGPISEELRLAFASNDISLSSTQNEISIVKESQSGNWQIRYTDRYVTT